MNASRWLWTATLCGMIAGCGKNPLSGQVDSLQTQLTELQAASADSQQVLANRVDYLQSQLSTLQAASADSQQVLANRVGILSGQVTNLQTTSIGSQQTLADRIDTLQGQLSDLRAASEDDPALTDRIDSLSIVLSSLQSVDWTVAAAQASPAVYAVMHLGFSGPGANPADITDTTKVTITYLGTAFAVDSHTLITNGHMVDGLVELNSKVQAFNTRNRANLKSSWIVVQNQAADLRYQHNYFFIGRHATHPDWDPNGFTFVDVGALGVLEGTLPRFMQLASNDEALALQVGMPIATLGFPGELQGPSGDPANYYPIATFKEGSISALRPPELGQPYAARDTYIIQHNLNLSPGTSGSPIFDPQGRVVAVNNSGMLTPEGGQSQVSQAGLGFGIRAEKIQELLTRLPASKPLATGSQLAGWLDGRRVADLDIHPASDDLESRLARLAR